MVNENEKRGSLIYELRKEQGLTQKDLSEKVNVTDKAVSKWERGISCPDVGLLIPLSKILNTTVSELLNGERSEQKQEDEEQLVKTALRYAGSDFTSRLGFIRSMMFILLSTALLIALVVCLIVDYHLNKTLHWSLLVMASLIFSWMLLLPFFLAKQHIIKHMLQALTILLLPYLWVLSLLLKLEEVFTLGSCISIILCMALWCMYAIQLHFKEEKFIACGISLLILLPATFAINHMVPFFIQSSTSSINDLINFISISLLAAISFLLHFITKRLS